MNTELNDQKSTNKHKIISPNEKKTVVGKSDYNMEKPQIQGNEKSRHIPNHFYFVRQI